MVQPHPRVVGDPLELLGDAGQRPVDQRTGQLNHVHEAGTVGQQPGGGEAQPEASDDHHSRLVAGRVPPGGTAAARAQVARAAAMRGTPAEFVREDFKVMRLVVEAAGLLPAVWMLNRLTSVYREVAEVRRPKSTKKAWNWRPPDMHDLGRPVPSFMTVNQLGGGKVTVGATFVGTPGEVGPLEVRTTPMVRPTRVTTDDACGAR